MLDIKFIRENTELVKEICKNKNISLDIDRLLVVDEEKRKLQTEIDHIRAQRNDLNENMRESRTEEMISETKELKEKLIKIEEEYENICKEYEKLMYMVPNIVSEETPVGKSEEDNVIIKTWGKIPKFNFKVKDHISLGKDLDLIDLEKGTKVHGFRGYYLKNEAAMLEMALMMYAFNKIIKKGFSPLITPSLVREFSLYGTGFFPALKDEIFKIQDKTPDNKDDDMYLAGTSEVAILSYFSDDILEKKNLPIKVCAFSPCFRSEVGSYGKDTKGLYRIHEFLKIEQIVLCENDIKESERCFKEMLGIVEEILQELGLPYRIKNICTGDIGMGKYYMNDVETYMPSREDYGETHSCSNLTDWQTRRLNIRYKEGETKKLCFALNNTVIASPRILIPLLENNQLADGSVKIPKVLWPYMNGVKKIFNKNEKKNTKFKLF